MKRPMLVLLTLLTLLLVCGCESADPIAQTQWQMEHIQSGDKGEIIIVGDETMLKTNPDATILKLSCRFFENAFVMENHENQESWTGSYRMIEHPTDRDAIYELIFENGTTGYAGYGFTTFADGSEKENLLFSVEDYALSFSGKQEI